MNKRIMFKICNNHYHFALAKKENISKKVARFFQCDSDLGSKNTSVDNRIESLEFPISETEPSPKF
jgi:hypothetical protein